MAGVSKKFSLNFKKNAKKRTGELRDDLEVPVTSVQSLSPNLSASRQGRSGKSSSLGSIHSEIDEELNQEDVVALTNNVRSFVDALNALKDAITVTEGSPCAEDIKITTLDKLGEVLHILRGVLQKYPVLQSTDVLTAAAILIAKIKSYNYDDMGNDGSELLAAVDQLALAFSTSVYEYLMGDIENYPRVGKAKSFDNLAAARDSEAAENAEQDKVYERLSPGEMDERLRRSEAGMDIAFERAKAWARYAKEIITYVEKRAHLECEFSKGLTKLANSVKQSITEDTFLPFQSVYCTALDQDMDYANTNQATSNLLTTVKFVEPLSNRRSEHEKMRKNLRDSWAKELRKMQESVTNLKKSKNAYISRKQDHEKSKESTIKAEADNLNQSSGSTQTKLEKKKKQEDDALFRSKEAEITYQTCVLEANHSQRELERMKGEILAQIRELVHHSDQIMKAVTTSYFQMLYSVSAAPPLQFQVLAESSGQYEPGGQYMEYIRRLPVTHYQPPEPFVFQQYCTEQTRSDGGGGRKPSTHSSGSGSELYGDESPHLSPRSASALGVGGKEEDDSVSGSSCKSSPTASPYPSHRTLLGTSNSSASMNELFAAADDRQHGSGGGSGGVSVFRGVSLSRAAQTHVFKKLRMASRCRQCETYVYFHGAECEKCGLPSHKKCLESLQWECGGTRGASSGRRMTTFGVDFSAHVQENHTQIPHLVRKCVEKIDEEGVELKGIYRVSGVKSKVEKLCQSFETEPGCVDLSEHNPNVVANVLKLYLRQLPEPIFTFKLYPELMKLAKENLEQKASCDEMVPALKLLIERLPAANLRTLSLLMHHLHHVTTFQPVNHMSATNLAIVFGPTLLRPSEAAASLDSLMDTPHQTRIIETLILHVQAIFGEPEFPPPTTSSTPAAASNSSNRTGRLDVVDEAPPTEASRNQGGDGDGEDRASVSWYVPEITENLLDELAKEEPRFQQMGREEPAVVASPEQQDSGVDSKQQGATQTSSSVADEDDEDEGEEEDWELEDSLLPDQSDSVNSPTHTTPLSSLKPPQGSISNTASPGLRRKILPSQVLPKVTSPTPQDSLKLTKPQPFVPSQPLRPLTPASSSTTSSTSSSPLLRANDSQQHLVTNTTAVSSSSSSLASSVSSLPATQRKPAACTSEGESSAAQRTMVEDSTGKVSPRDRQPRYV